MASLDGGVANGFVRESRDPAREARRRVSSFLSLNPKTPVGHRMSDVGDPRIPALGLDLDIRTDVPTTDLARRRSRGRADRHHGALARRPRRLRARLLVLVRRGADGGRPADPSHRSVRCAYRCTAPNIACQPAGPSPGPMVVSMRPYKPEGCDPRVQITSRFPSVHGAPVHLRHPHSIVLPTSKARYGDPVPVEADELPVFWA